MTLLISLLLCLAAPEPAATDPPVDGEEVFSCDFGAEWDHNFDTWPDHWSRQTGKGYPRYVEIGIVDDSRLAEGRSLKIELDGGAAAVFSPPIEIDPQFSYHLMAKVRTQRLKHNRVYLSLTLLDERQEPLRRETSAEIGAVGQWTELSVGPIDASDKTRQARIGMHVEPRSQADLFATAWFTEIRLLRLPKIVLRANHAHHVYKSGEPVTITCEASGLIAEEASVLFETWNGAGNLVRKETLPLVRELPAVTVAAPPGEADKEEPHYAGRAIFQPPLPTTGFFRIAATVQIGKRDVHQRSLSLALIADEGESTSGRFGWTIPSITGPFEANDLADLLGRAAIYLVKFPIWPESERDVARLSYFIDRLAEQDIGVVGMLHEPPQSLQQRAGGVGIRTLDEVFASDPQELYDALQPLLMKLGFRVRWWQLDAEGQMALVQNPRLEETVEQVQSALGRLGARVELGISWPWQRELPSDVGPLSFVSLTAVPPLTAPELSFYLADDKSRGLRRWVALRPLPRQAYTEADRAADLVHRMVAAYIHGADRIFADNPFDSDTGLLNSDGTPTPLFVVWQTTATALADAEYIGSLRLPAESKNHVFLRDRTASMILWNPTPLSEVLYLGDDVRVIDLFGRTAAPSRIGGAQEIEAGPIPRFVTNIDADVVQWRMAIDFRRGRVPSLFGHRHPEYLEFSNTSQRSISGKIKLVPPKGWTCEPDEITFRLVAGESLHSPLAITLPYDVEAGPQPIRIDMQIQAEQDYEFSCVRPIEVGLGDIDIEILTHLDINGNLLVEQRTRNRGDKPLNLVCSLFAPGRRRQRRQILRLDTGIDVRTYNFARGAELQEQTLWLRAEEISGARVLNYRFVVEP